MFVSPREGTSYTVTVTYLMFYGFDFIKNFKKLSILMPRQNDVLNIKTLKMFKYQELTD